MLCNINITTSNGHPGKTMPLQVRLFLNLVVLHILATYLNLLHAEGTIYIVGDLDGWAPFTQSSNWIQGREFHVGDVLVFNYEKGLHNVMQVNSTAYEECIKDTYKGLFISGTDSVKLTEVGQTWFICGVSDHCENGQKLKVSVVP